MRRAQNELIQTLNYQIFMFDVSKLMPNECSFVSLRRPCDGLATRPRSTPPLRFDIHLSNKSPAIMQLGSKTEGWIIRGKVKLNSRDSLTASVPALRS